MPCPNLISVPPCWKDPCQRKDQLVALSSQHHVSSLFLQPSLDSFGAERPSLAFLATATIDEAVWICMLRFCLFFWRVEPQNPNHILLRKFRMLWLLLRDPNCFERCFQLARLQMILAH